MESLILIFPSPSGLRTLALHFGTWLEEKALVTAWKEILINADTPFGSMKLPITKEGGTTRNKKNKEDGGDDDDDDEVS